MTAVVVMRQISDDSIEVAAELDLRRWRVWRRPAPRKGLLHDLLRKLGVMDEHIGELHGGTPQASHHLFEQGSVVVHRNVGFSCPPHNLRMPRNVSLNVFKRAGAPGPAPGKRSQRRKRLRR